MGASRTQGNQKKFPHCQYLERSRSRQKLDNAKIQQKIVLLSPCDGTRTTIRHSLGPTRAIPRASGLLAHSALRRFSSCFPISSNISCDVIADYGESCSLVLQWYCSLVLVLQWYLAAAIRKEVLQDNLLNLRAAALLMLFVSSFQT